MMELSAISLIPVNSTVRIWQTELLPHLFSFNVQIIIFLVKFQFALDSKSATYTLTLETPTAIDNILIECNVAINLLDVEKNTAVISHSEAPSSKVLLLYFLIQLSILR